MKKWNKPKLIQLGIEKTESGGQREEIDGDWIDLGVLGHVALGSS